MDILFHNADFAVCIKPVGLDSERDIPAALQQLLGGEFFTLHRLDKNVGGVMVYARNKASAAALSKAIAQGDMVKEYLALVHGTPPAEGDWEDWLFKDSRKNKVFVVKRQRNGVKAARLTYRLLRGGEQSLVRIRLYTGRSHQIRVQFASRGFPLVGDHKYGSRDSATAPKLFSASIAFPYKGQTVRYEALPDWEECL
ncbi:MAG: RNA pseudouridine synthase [Oscillospiraceae bacterium]|nr:RNA pseudouridine synthase [Oscillospiraceae bacterium]